jgi:HK97 family phage prohead protease
MKVTEQRFFRNHIELRASNRSYGIGVLTGYAAKFNSPSEDLGGFREIIKPGAFASSLRRGSDVRCLVNHDPSLVLGRSTNGTLLMREDATGLRIACSLPDTSYAKDLYESVKRGDISQMSFAFKVADDGEDWSDSTGDDGLQYSLRTLRNVDLIDTSFVTYPAYPDTEASTDDRLDPSLVMGRSLWPSGIPAEIRSRIPGITQRSATTPQDRRKQITNFILGL